MAYNKSPFFGQTTALGWRCSHAPCHIWLTGPLPSSSSVGGGKWRETGIVETKGFLTNFLIIQKMASLIRGSQNDRSTFESTIHRGNWLAGKQQLNFVEKKRVEFQCIRLRNTLYLSGNYVMLLAEMVLHLVSFWLLVSMVTAASWQWDRTCSICFLATFR